VYEEMCIPQTHKIVYFVSKLSHYYI
jgi:hypothetical protein